MIQDWGHVLAVYCRGFGANDAMRNAKRECEEAGWKVSRAGGAFRASLRGENPDPAEFPSDFEVLVRVEGRL
jgi:hypothetical protein